MFTSSKNRAFDELYRVPSQFGMAFIAMTIAISSRGYAIDPNCVARVDWTTLPSTYTHDATGNRVDQYAQGIEPISNESPNLERSGFRHTRSTLQAGNSADNLHVVEKWGPAVQPYGEWRYPYRPYSVPYGAWGPQSPLVNSQQNNTWGVGQPGFHPNHPGGGNMGMPPMGPGMPPNGPNGMNGMGGFHQGGMGAQGFWPGNAGPSGYGNNGFGVGPNNALRPDQDDFYPMAPDAPPVSDRDFFFLPNNRRENGAWPLDN